MDFGDCIYVGHVMHLRLIPKRHKFRYKVFSLLLDIDNLDQTGSKFAFLKIDRFGLISFFSKDHGPRDNTSLRTWLDTLFDSRSIVSAEKVFLLSFPRVLGFGFSPLSIYYCYNKNKLTNIVYEVKNTFGDQVPYVLPVGTIKNKLVRQKHQKEMYVSPFIEMDQTYEFTLAPLGERLSVKIQQSGKEGMTLIAAQTGKAKPLSDWNLLLSFLTHPLMGLKVVVAIHWQALRLFVRGIKYIRYYSIKQ